VNKSEKNEQQDEYENELEALVLRESIVSATGLSNSSVQIGIKGDPSLRETTLERKKYESPVDKVMDKLIVNIENLLLNRSTYRVFIGFNSGEIRTNSIFDPLRQETHEAEKLADSAYIERHFPKVKFAEKIQAMRDIYKLIGGSKLFKTVPDYWKRIFSKRHDSWEPMTEDEIKTIMTSVKIMRDLPDFLPAQYNHMHSAGYGAYAV